MSKTDLLCTMCDSISYEHTVQDEVDEFIICEWCQLDGFTKVRADAECFKCSQYYSFHVGLPQCKHRMCHKCCSNTYLGWIDDRFTRTETCFFKNEPPIFPEQYSYEKYSKWWLDNFRGELGKEWYRYEKCKYIKRVNRESWMNTVDMLRYEDMYIQYVILDDMNYCKFEELDVMRNEVATRRCPLCF
jgi:hypothetical protein